MTQVPPIDGRNLRRIGSRAKIFATAMDLLKEHPYQDLSIDTICKTAKVGRATFFRAFKTKAGLLQEFNSQLTQRIVQQLESAQPSGVDQALRIIADEVTRTWSSAHPGAKAMAIDFIRTSVLDNVHAGYPELQELVVDIIDQGAANGELDNQLPTPLLASQALFQITGAVAYWLINQDLNLNKLVNESVDVWLYGTFKTQ